MNSIQRLSGTTVLWLLFTSACTQADDIAPQESAETPKVQTEHKYTNALIDSTSPYLLQHAHNPVNWMPWGPEAFEKAQRENKPVFVSIGYSTCYWCHVMERQSFEEEEVAAILNEHYVAIKVDREERPDIDEQLMLATQIMTGRGGWPNSVWLTSDGRPWMAGTYFPKAQFMSALTELARVWREQADNVEKQAESLAAAIRSASTTSQKAATTTQLDGGPLQTTLDELARIYDEKNGGFGSRPKFPPHGVLRLLAIAAERGDAQARLWMTSTLDAMVLGGIHDHVGGGYHRYSTDERWFLPHFEKMLYDNAQLMRALTEAYVVTKEPRYRFAVDDIFSWLEREMTDTQGGFYSAIDSESEDGEEGKYYTWSSAELAATLTEDEAEEFATVYHFEDGGNFAEEATGRRPGTNIPYLTADQQSILTSPKFAAIRTKLNTQRKDRIYPHLDDKILAGWNGLMISSLARAGDVFDDPRYVLAAEKAAKFVLNEMNHGGELQRSWRSGKATIPGYLNDYAFLAEAFIELYRATENEDWLRHAEQFADVMISKFEDTRAGGFFFSSEQHEKLLLRSKNLMGGGNLPLGNGVAVQVLLHLDEVSGTSKYRNYAERTLRSFADLMAESPRQVEHLVLANELFIQTAAESP